MLCDGLDADLRSGGIAVRDRFLTSGQVRALAACAARRRERGEFAAARIGAGSHAAAPGGHSRRFHSLVDGAAVRAGARAYGIARAVAPAIEPRCVPRAVRARDALRLVSARRRLCAPCRPAARFAGSARVSLVLYLNQRWKAADGGVLRIFADDGRYRDIEPLARAPGGFFDRAARARGAADAVQPPEPHRLVSQPRLKFCSRDYRLCSRCVRRPARYARECIVSAGRTRTKRVLWRYANLA